MLAWVILNHDISNYCPVQFQGEVVWVKQKAVSFLLSA